MAIFAEKSWSLPQWGAELAAPGVIILLVADAERQCGFLSSGIAGDDLEIRKIGVLSAYRRQGVGRRLLQRALSIAPPTIRRCLIEVSSANRAGIAFYQEMGFLAFGHRSNYYADGSAAILMEKILSAP